LIAFTVAGKPVPYKRTNGGAHGRYTHPAHRAHATKVATLARVAHRRRPPLDGPRLLANAIPVVLECVFVFPRPGPRTMKPGPRVRFLDDPDLSNLLKLVEDALQDAGVLTNDCRVDGYAGSGRWYAATGEEAHTAVKVWPLVEPG